MLFASIFTVAGVLMTASFNANAATNTKQVTVKSGDTVSKIAKQHNTSVNSIVKVNHLNNVNMIHVGEKLTLPTNANNMTYQSNNTQTQQPTAQVSSNASYTAAPKQTTQAAQPAQTQQQATTTTTTAQPAATPAASNNSASNTGDDSGLASIAQVESGNSYSARNGQYIGKYQLSSSYLNGDYSPANQERVARQYAVSRYGSVAAAAQFRASHNYW
ncbi:aggregation-promoting factor [Fructilactobacillus fructivorans]|uniref:aggregation-promoting factor n=1 Tax=Fructilactobacillus fructivorans TaxID=1614 RepID=UPI00057E9139|nr:LysM domain-containing protein [Fructilactobacillus fructivorans]MCT2867009.1 LysM domain-containing protein [Fructilactobacillus fructivorans]MCT2869310.1 LysM domain-containing protein [Fructilactobacillus fructivorans]MCT2873653.1 LysM domain-containing protein [Fructilactobacillus fructivorans]